MIATQAGVELASMAFHPESETYRAEYDQDAVSASMAVVAVLSEVMDVDPVELEPLHTSINTGALDNLARVRDGTGEGVSITFRVATYAITVSNDGTVALTSREQTGTDGVTEGVSPV